MRLNQSEFVNVANIANKLKFRKSTIKFSVTNSIFEVITYVRSSIENRAIN